MVEPWLRDTLREHDALKRQVLHALQLTEEDVERWCAALTDEQMNLTPCAGVAPVAYHLRHIARSLDRLLSYAEGRQLSNAQLAFLRSELEPGAHAEDVLAEFRAGLRSAFTRILALSAHGYEEPRAVGRERLPTTVGGLLVHCAEHTQRHTGQAVTTAQVVRCARAFDL